MPVSGLLFEQAPPVSVPLRFLLTAPWFAVLAGALLAWAGPDALASRWTPALLGVTHLLTLGFMATAMVGALLQILPGAGLLAASGLTLGVSLLRAWWVARDALCDVKPLPVPPGARRHGWRELKAPDPVGMERADGAATKQIERNT